MNNFLKIILHAIVMGLLFLIPVVLAMHPVWLDYSIGSLLNAIYLWLVATKASPSGIGFATKSRY